MRCPKCGKDVELQKKQVGVDENGKPIFNEYAICRDCKKQWNLDKQRAKKAADASASDHTQSKESTPAQVKPVKKASEAAPASVPPSVKKAPVKKDTPENAAVKKTAPKKRPVAPDAKPASPSPKAASPSKPVSPSKPAPKENPAAPVKKPVSGTTASPVSKVSGTTAGPVSKTGPDGKPVQRKRPVSSDTGSQKSAGESSKQQRYSNIPPEKVRAKREKAVRDSYEDMLASDPNRKPVKKKRPAAPEGDPVKKKPAAASSAPARKKPAPKPVLEVPAEKDEPKPKFRLIRIIFGIISIVAFGFFAYKALIAGLNNISAGTNAATGTIYIVLALCMLVSGLLLLIMQKKHTIFAFLLPLIFYTGGAVFAFLKRSDDKFLLYGAIAGGVFAVIFLVLTIASKRSDDEYDYDDDEYDDPFDEDNY